MWLRVDMASELQRILTVRDMYERGECPKEYMEDVTEAALRRIVALVRKAETVDVALTVQLLRGDNPSTFVRRT